MKDHGNLCECENVLEATVMNCYILGIHFDISNCSNLKPPSWFCVNELTLTAIE